MHPWTGPALGTLVGVALIGLAGCGPDRPRTEETTAAAEVAPTRPPRGVDPALVERGRALYADHCALCHGPEGEGYAADGAPALANPDFLSIASDRFLETAIDYGRPGTSMSAWSEVRGGPFDEADTEAVVELLRSWQTEPSVDVGDATARPDPASVARGDALYAEHCAACHGAEGEGLTAPSLRNPYFLSLVSDGWLERSIAVGRPGTPMPAFADSLAPAAIADLVALLRSWERPPGAPPVDTELPDFGESLVVHPSGEPASFATRDDRFVPADDVHAALVAGRRLVLLDARPTSDWLAGHIPGSVPVPFYDARWVVDHLPEDGTWIVVYCACPHAASGLVVDALRAAGFERSAILDEGILVWAERGYPIEGSVGG